MRRFRVGLAVALLTVLGGTANAAIYTPDTKIGQAFLDNSGDQTELDALAGILGVDASTLSIDQKLEDSGLTVQVDDTNLYVDVAPNEPGWFMVKMGNLGSGGGLLNPPLLCGSDTCNTFFFTNIAELTKLVFTPNSIGLASLNPNIDKISHITSVVPLPAALPLLGTGLLALWGIGRMRRQQVDAPVAV